MRKLDADQRRTLPRLRDRQDLPVQDVPRIGQMDWGRHSLSVLQWQHEPWTRLRDVPEVLFEPGSMAHRSAIKACPPWRQVAARWLRL
ncbi:hypothetical protein [Pseudomonas donghuensis]|uniref:hypothetical protein n=1 Tax=Pseudomonas donghuensis TaxID=1163398 RepID=UPI002E14205E|nr:hypothetical protein VP780_20375 [Pseudomonas donghuensis]